MNIQSTPNHPMPKSCGWRVENGNLIVVDNARLPQRCVKTNQPAAPRQQTRTLYYFPAWIYIFLLAGGIPMILAFLITRTPVTVTYYTSPSAPRLAWIKIGVAFLLGNLFMMIGCCGVLYDIKPLSALFILLSLTSFVAILFLFNNLGVKKRLGNGEFVLSGVNKAFIAELSRAQAPETKPLERDT